VHDLFFSRELGQTGAYTERAGEVIEGVGKGSGSCREEIGGMTGERRHRGARIILRGALWRAEIWGVEGIHAACRI
jgi:hypothetical protein